MYVCAGNPRTPRGHTALYFRLTRSALLRFRTEDDVLIFVCYVVVGLWEANRRS